MSWDTLLEDYVGFGTAASRPASGTPAPSSFEFYYAYDTTTLSVWNSNTSAWDTVSTGGGSGVTSVGLSMPAIFTVTGSPVTTTGTLTATLATQTANYGFMGPASGVAAAPTFRAFVSADFPALVLGIGSINATGTPSSTTFLRGDGTWSPASGGGSGTVTSVAMTVPADFSVSGSPITTSGTLAVTENTQSANLLKAGPASGTAAVPTYRALVGADFPATTIPVGSINATGTPSSTTYLRGDGSWSSPSGSGTVTSVALTMPSIFSVAGSPVTSSGTLAVTLATESANYVWAGPTSGAAAAPTFRALVDGDLPAGVVLLSQANSFTNQQAVTPYRANITGAVSIDLSATGKSNNLHLTLTGNVTSFALTNPVDGAVYNIRFIQDATGSRTFAGFPSAFKFPGGIAPVFSTAANAVDFLSAEYGSTEATYMAVFNQGMA